MSEPEIGTIQIRVCTGLERADPLDPDSDAAPTWFVFTTAAPEMLLDDGSEKLLIHEITEQIREIRPVVRMKREADARLADQMRDQLGGPRNN